MRLCLLMWLLCLWIDLVLIALFSRVAVFGYSVCCYCWFWWLGLIFGGFLLVGARLRFGLFGFVY